MLYEYTVYVHYSISIYGFLLGQTKRLEGPGAEMTPEPPIYSPLSQVISVVSIYSRIIIGPKGFYSLYSIWHPMSSDKWFWSKDRKKKKATLKQDIYINFNDKNKDKCIVHCKRWLQWMNPL